MALYLRTNVGSHSLNLVLLHSMISVPRASPKIRLDFAILFRSKADYVFPPKPKWHLLGLIVKKWRLGLNI